MGKARVPLLIGLVGGFALMAVAIVVAAGIGNRDPEPTSAPSVGIDDVTRTVMRELSASHGMTWRIEPGQVVGTWRDLQLRFIGSPIDTAVLIVPAKIPQQAWDATVDFNVAMARVLEGPPALVLAWVENELDAWTGRDSLDEAISELGFDLTLRSSGDPRQVTYTVHRNPGAWRPPPVPTESLPTVPAPTEAALPCADLEEPVAGVDHILVFFTCEHPPADPRPVVREAPASAFVVDSLRIALEQYLAGPTPEEREAGLSSALPLRSEGLLIGVDFQQDGLAILDFAKELQMNNLNTSHMRFLLFGTLSRTISQFDAVTAIEYRIDGTCEAFERYFEGTCRFVRERVGVYGDWLLTGGFIDGQRVLMSEDTRTTIVIESGVLRGEAPCNVYGAPITISGDSAVIGELESTQRACAQLAFEQTYFGALTRVTIIRTDQGLLALAGDGIDLRFGPRSAVMPSP